MHIEPAPKLPIVVAGWHRVADEDGSTVAYCPDVVTANMIVRDMVIRQHLIDRCGRTCADRERYSGRLRHEADCPAYDLDLV